MYCPYKQYIRIVSPRLVCRSHSNLYVPFVRPPCVGQQVVWIALLEVGQPLVPLSTECILFTFGALPHTLLYTRHYYYVLYFSKRFLYYSIPVYSQTIFIVDPFSHAFQVIVGKLKLRSLSNKGVVTSHHQSLCNEMLSFEN